MKVINIILNYWRNIRKRTKMSNEKIIVMLILEAEKKIKKELEKIENDIEDFSKQVPIPSVINEREREAYFEERMTGRLSTDNLRKNYELKLFLEKQLHEIEEYKWHHKEDFVQEQTKLSDRTKDALRRK